MIHMDGYLVGGIGCGMCTLRRRQMTEMQCSDHFGERRPRGGKRMRRTAGREAPVVWVR
jgi:hypothetical protein